MTCSLKVLVHKHCDRSALPDEGKIYQFTCPVCEALWEWKPTRTIANSRRVSQGLFKKSVWVDDPYTIEGYWHRRSYGHKVWEDAC